MMQTAVKAKKPRKQAVSGCFWAGRTYRGRIKDDHKIDPCMGSGHILVYAFDVFMQIYVSEGWTEKEAAKSILQNNLYGLDIDERAYQLSYFALMMKARQYNRRILSEGINPNVMAIEESNTFNKDLLNRFGDLKLLAERVLDIFIDAKEYGSILNVDFTKEEIDSLEDKLNEIDKMADYGNLLDQAESIHLFNEFDPLLKQARIMSQKYECVVTNPPYMGASGMNDKLSTFVKKYYPNSKSDLSTIFMEKNSSMTAYNGRFSMINIPVWMFLTTYERLRNRINRCLTISSLIHCGRGIFGSDFGSVAFVIRNAYVNEFRGKYYRLFDNSSSVESPDEKEKRFLNGSGLYRSSQSIFKNVPGSPIAYWLSSKFISIFKNDNIDDNALKVCKGGFTGNNDKYLRLWFEINANSTDQKWNHYSKGGPYRKWYGNSMHVINWENNGFELKNDPHAGMGAAKYYGLEHIVWSGISISKASFRYDPSNVYFDDVSPAIVFEKELNWQILGLLNSKIGEEILKVIAPTVHFQAGDIKVIPVANDIFSADDALIKDSVQTSKKDWDSFETSWDFERHPLIRGLRTVKEAYETWDRECTDRFNKLKANEEELNRIFIDIYGLQDELTPEVEEKDITVRKADLNREIKSLISYAVGCMFGRYSLDVKGLAYAGGEWDDSKYMSFNPDKDNIIPICDDEYFEDDIVGKFIEFIKVTYGEDTLEENLWFIANALGGKGTSREVIRSYFINDFYKDHCNTYQVTGSGKRPIYWQFDSGKKNGFKALIYIHRYTPDLIARMRTSYVHEQQSRYVNQISMIQNRIDSATSTSERVKAEKELKKLKEQADELRVYEEKIHHWADKMEPMDLDDGVKTNYAKFQELLTKIK